MSRKPNRSLTAAKARKSRAIAAGLTTAIAELDLPEMDELEKFGIRCMSNNYIGVIYVSGLGMDVGTAYESWADTCTALRSKAGPPPIGSAVFLIPDVCGLEATLAGIELHCTQPVPVLAGRSFQMARVPLSMFGAA
ncbi:hypothetical protein NJL88_11560 [Streptomyces sp. DK15]|uniref:hypothetical protein n=1 Tax=Streptomyces sp. DK15 TaxID=2957499 RepID=UPI0029B36ABE|nr:hypothetical protein [Streptomyces sp. DK15]MDX2390690.1 hypothetical protein [Streptomyces sp. DK15]